MARVLVVDDDATICGFVADLLGVGGHDVHVAQSGVEALAALFAQPVDCVVLDVMMPGMSGLQVLERVRLEPTLCRLPVVLLTARVDDESTWQGWRAGADVYLHKPFDPENLLEWVDRLCHVETGQAPAERAPASHVDAQTILAELAQLSA